MKKLFLFILPLVSIAGVYGQKVKSSCTASETIKAQYRNDADRMATRRVFKVLSNYIDSSTIPKTWSDTILNALMAVYNADSLPARDTVVFLRKLHTFPNPVLNNFYMAADSNLPWMQQLRKDSLYVGKDSVGYLIKTYDLHVARYYRINKFPYHIIIFESKRNYNLDVITRQFDKLGGVYYANKSRVEGDGNDIKDIVTKNFVELVYSFGWGDCSSGCTNKRYWKFNVYYDCSVEFKGSYGTKWDPGSVSNRVPQNMFVKPNPFRDKIELLNFLANYEYRLFNSSGQMVRSAISHESTIDNLENLPQGIYFLQIIEGRNVRNFKLVKE